MKAHINGFYGQDIVMASSPPEYCWLFALKKTDQGGGSQAPQDPPWLRPRYDSLYHNIILNEVQEQVLNLVGRSSFTSIQVVPVRQQANSSDCEVFAAAFTTCLAYGIHPEKMQFDVPRMRNHLYQSLKFGVLKMMTRQTTVIKKI